MFIFYKIGSQELSSLSSQLKSAVYEHWLSGIRPSPDGRQAVWVPRLGLGPSRLQPRPRQQAPDATRPASRQRLVSFGEASGSREQAAQQGRQASRYRSASRKLRSAESRQTSSLRAGGRRGGLWWARSPSLEEFQAPAPGTPRP